jgi:hypothetical protein
VLGLGLALGLGGCGGAPRGLTPEEVTSLPPGNASGSDVSGDYELEAFFADCDGRCPLVGPFEVSTCDVGTVGDVDAEITQEDGRLTVDVNSSLLDFRAEGGINADGTFDVGGYATQLGGAVEVIARFSGTVGADGQLVAEGQVLARGEVDGETIDCVGTFELDGSR